MSGNLHATGKYTSGVRTIEIPFSLDESIVNYICWEKFNKQFGLSTYIVYVNGSNAPFTLSYDGGFLVMSTLFSKKPICLRNLRKCTREGKMVTMDTMEYGLISFKLSNVTSAIAFCSVIGGFMCGRIRCRRNIMDWNIPELRYFVNNPMRVRKKQFQKVHPGCDN